MDEGRALVQHFGWIDYTVFSGMLLLSSAIGIFCGCFGNRARTTDELLLANREMKTFPMAMSFLASYVSAIFLLGLPAEMYNFGTQYLVAFISNFLATPVTNYAFLPVFYDLKITSAYEYLDMRFNNAVRQLGYFLFVIFMVLLMAVVVYAPALALQHVTGLNLYVVISAVFLVCIFYTSVGGMRAVIWTDTFQTIIMFAAMIAVAAKGSLDVGGPAVVWNQSVSTGRLEFFNMNFDPTVRHTFWSVFVGIFFVALSVNAANQAQIQRYLTVPTINHARNALWINSVGLCILTFLTGYVGLLIYAKYAECDPLSSKSIHAPDQLLPLFVMDTMKDYPGYAGLFVAGIFSASLSTVSTGLNSLAAITIQDVLVGCFKKSWVDNRAARLPKWIAIGYGLFSFGLVFVVEQLGALLQISLSIQGVLGGCVLGLFVLGMFFPWANSIGAFCGTVISLIVVFWISIGARTAYAAGQITYPRKETSTLACPSNITHLERMNSTTQLFSSEPFILYKLSYLWYAPMGCFITIAAGMLISLITGPQDPKNVEPKLLSPTVRWIFCQQSITFCKHGKEQYELDSTRCVGGQKLLDPAITIPSAHKLIDDNYSTKII